MDKTVYVIIFAIFLGIVGGPGIALLAKGQKYRKDHADKKAKFEAGQGKDPDKSIIGPHRPFVVNAVVAGLICTFLGGFVAYLVA